MAQIPNIGNYAISDTGAELEAMFHGTTLNQVVNLYGVYNRAARRVMEEADPQEVRNVASFGKVYNNIFDYPVFTDLKGDRVVDFYPQANRTSLDDYGQQYGKDFDLQKFYSVKPDFTMRYSGAVRTIRINAANLPTGIQVNAADIINDNGTWNAGGNASAPTNNMLFYTNGVSGSVQTTLANTGVPGSTGYLENSTMNPVSLVNDFANNADEFFQVYLPNPSSITGIEYRIGSSSSNYYVLSAITTTNLGNTFATGWNLIKAATTSMTKVGNPNLAAINYIRIAFTYDGTLQNQILINQCYSRIGVLFNMEYYSKYLFRDGTTGVFKEKVTADTDVINLDTDGYNLFLYAAAIDAAQQMQGANALFFDATSFGNSYTEALTNYKQKYRGETIKPHSYYYNQPQSGYRRYLSSSWGLPPA